jgi:hypothetical protein
LFNNFIKSIFRSNAKKWNVFKGGQQQPGGSKHVLNGDFLNRILNYFAGI